MRFSEQWLREWSDPPVKTAAIADSLNFLGLEVASVEPAAPEFRGVVVGHVKKVQPHPDADRLRVCQVDAGNGELLQIVCGAANVHAGMKAPLAKIGAQLPNEVQIKKGKLRGVESFGMLCSQVELGLTEKAEGLMELPDDAPIGADVRAYLKLDDSIIEVDLTPNRGDCFSVKGIAREVALANGLSWDERWPSAVKSTATSDFPVLIEAPQACPRYVGRVIEGMDTKALSPFWLIERLRRSGIRSIHPIVDVTNYVMLEMGQPMHAFDLDKLKGKIVVRQARMGESLKLLDESEITLDAETLVIADAEAPCALAGIMGGKASAVSAATQRIFLESAFFTPAAIQGRARHYGKHTDSSHRFERGVAFDLQEHAMQRVTALILQIAGGKAGPIIEIVNKPGIPQARPIHLRRKRISKVLGYTLDDKRIESILSGLGAVATAADNGWNVIPPAYRFDLRIEADLIEELIRIYGYKNLPRTVPAYLPEKLQYPETCIPMDTLTSSLIQHGYQEVVCYSFVDPAIQALLEPERSACVLSNPISEEMSEMRTSLLPGLLNTLQYNVNRQQNCLQIFEIGSRFTRQVSEIKEKMMVAGLRYGNVRPEHWAQPAQPNDFYDIKGDVERLLLSAHKNPRFENSAHPALHPGQSASVYLDDVCIGWVGAVHPRVMQVLDLGLERNAYVFELGLEYLLEGCVPRYKPISRYPAIRRDLALVVDEAVSWAELEQSLLSVAPAYLSEVRLFDVYRGKGVTPGRKSFAMGLILQEISRTLTDVEIEAAISRILQTLNQNLGATLRE